MRKKFLCVLLAILFLVSITAYGDGFEKDTRAMLLGEYESGKILYEYSIDSQIEVASLTKIMTYLVTMDYVSSGKIGLEDMITVSLKASKTPGSSFKLKEGEELSLKVLLDSIMIVSANDSCVAIAEHISGSEDAFTKLMNEKAKEIGLKKTYFVNSSGYPLKDGEQNMMSTRDLFKLTRYVITKYPQILETTKINQIFMPTRDFDNENTNPLLKLIKDVDGFKTGYTDKAGYCLISTIKVKEDENNKKPFRLIGIVMGATSEEERRDKSKNLIEYGLENYSYKQILNKDISVKTINIINAKNPSTMVFPQRDLCMFVRKGQNIQQEIIFEENIKAPIKAGTKIGKIVVSNGEDQKHSIDLIIKDNVQKKNILDKLFDYLLNMVSK